MKELHGSLGRTLRGSTTAGPVVDPQLNRDYQRQRQMTRGDLLLENRIIFLQGEIHDGNANDLANIFQTLFCKTKTQDWGGWTYNYIKPCETELCGPNASDHTPKTVVVISPTEDTNINPVNVAELDYDAGLAALSNF